MENAVLMVAIVSRREKHIAKSIVSSQVIGKVLFTTNYTMWIQNSAPTKKITQFYTPEMREKKPPVFPSLNAEN